LSNFSNNLFIHLRVHSAYSLSFGALQIDKIIDLAKSKKIDCPEKIQGESKLVQFIEDNKKFANFILEHITSNF